jgi:hypothetical protein
VAQVLTDVRRKASLPATSTDWTDTVILREATDVLWSFAGWALAQAGEGRLLSSIDRVVSSALTGVYGKNEFVLPPLAVASSIDMVAWTDADGKTQSRLSRIDHAEEPVWSGLTETGSPSMYALIGDRIRVYPTPTTGGTLRITFPRRHSELVPDTTQFSGGIGSLNVVTATTTQFVTAHIGLGVGDMIDIVTTAYPHVPVITYVEVIAQGGGTITIPASVAQLSGFDSTTMRVVKSGQTPYVSLPLEMRAAFTEKVCANILRIVGDLQGMAACEQAAGLELARAMMLLSPRSKRDKPYTINPYSHLRMGLRRG